MSEYHYLPLAPPFFFILVGLFVILLVLAFVMLVGTAKLIQRQQTSISIYPTGPLPAVNAP